MNKNRSDEDVIAGLYASIRRICKDLGLEVDVLNVQISQVNQVDRRTFSITGFVSDDLDDIMNDIDDTPPAE